MLHYVYKHKQKTSSDGYRICWGKKIERKQNLIETKGKPSADENGRDEGDA